MANYRIAYKTEDGKLCIIIPVDQARLDGENDLDFASRIALQSVPEGTPSVVVESRNLPQGRVFRDAWDLDFDTSQVVVDMPRAREIHRTYLRVARTPHLQDLDIRYVRAQETNDEAEKTLVAELKQALRDLPEDPDIESASTPEDLMATWPSDLLPSSPYPEEPGE